MSEKVATKRRQGVVADLVSFALNEHKVGGAASSPNAIFDCAQDRRRRTGGREVRDCDGTHAPLEPTRTQWHQRHYDSVFSMQIAPAAEDMLTRREYAIDTTYCDSATKRRSEHAEESGRHTERANARK